MGKVGGIGAKLLGKFGWQEGQALGLNEDGLKEPIRPNRHRSKKTEGIGNKKNVDDKWWENLMTSAYGGGAGGTTTNAVDLFKACEGRRCRPHGTAKLARLDAHADQFAQSNGKQHRNQDENGVHSESDSDSDSDSSSDSDADKDVHGGDIKKGEAENTKNISDLEHNLDDTNQSDSDSGTKNEDQLKKNCDEMLTSTISGDEDDEEDSKEQTKTTKRIKRLEKPKKNSLKVEKSISKRKKKKSKKTTKKKKQKT